MIDVITAFIIAGLASFFSLPPAIDELPVAPGFEISLFASDVEDARQMALGDSGTVFVGSRHAGNVYALIDTDNDGRADKQILVAKDLNMPSGVAYRDGDLYVAAVDRVLRYVDIEAHLASPPAALVVVDTLPDDAHHGWKAITFGGDGMLYVPVGMPCNICLSDDRRHGTILKLDVATGRYSIYATGVRNSVGLAFHPQHNTLWFSDNGRDWMGDDLPPDEINRADRPGLHFGFPYLHGRKTLDPDYGEQAELNEYTLPAVELGAHVAPLGLAFYTGRQFPKKYRHSLLVAEHGSWNRSEKTGYRVISVQFDGDRVARVEALVSGWLNTAEDEAWGRPVDILNMPDGSVLISDDFADAIYRLSYRGSR
jgi:glucose/arabinose dehydrogenase